MLEYLKNHPGATKPEIIASTGMTPQQLNVAILALSEYMYVVTVGSGPTRFATCYLTNILDPENKPTIIGARVVNAGRLLFKKYGYISPPLRKAEHRGISSGMGGTVYD
jgi:hypothetical protein